MFIHCYKLSRKQCEPQVFFKLFSIPDIIWYSNSLHKIFKYVFEVVSRARVCSPKCTLHPRVLRTPLEIAAGKQYFWVLEGRYSGPITHLCSIVSAVSGLPEVPFNHLSALYYLVLLRCFGLCSLLYVW